MRLIVRSLIPLALVLAVSACNNKKDANEKRVVLLFTTDEHSQLYGSSPELDDFLGVSSASLQGGVLRRMTILKQQRDAATSAGKATLTLSSGDFSQGSLASAAWLAMSPELATMKTMGYDAVSIGNHEFDLGAAGLLGTLTAIGSGAPPLVLSNLINPAELAPMYGVGKPIAPYLVLTTSNGLRIGIVGSMGVEAGTVAGAAPPNAFWPASATTTTTQFGAVAAEVQAQVDAVRGQGVDAVILLAHGGIGADSQHPGEDELMALQLKGVDLVLSGHSHSFTPTPRIVYGSGTAVPVVQPKPYGRNVGKVELVFRDDDVKRPYLDPNGTQFFDVNGTVAKSTDPTLVGELQTRTIGFLEFGLDGPTSTALPSFLESTLSKVTGAPVHADPLNPGNLWNFFMGIGLTNGCKLSFDVTSTATTGPAGATGESNAMNLDADAIQFAVNAITPTEIGIQAYGPVRGGLIRSHAPPGSTDGGTTSEIGFADVYHIAPLGGDPTAVPPTDLNPATNPVGIQTYLNAVPGYPLVRINIPTVAVRLAYEGTLQAALGLSGDFFVGAGGLEVEYDITRTKLDLVAAKTNPLLPGWVTFMALPNVAPPSPPGSSPPFVIYDVSQTAWQPYGYFNPLVMTVPPAPPTFRSVATTFYVAKFASSFGIPIYNGSFQEITTDAQLAGAIVRRTDTSAIKDYEALAEFIRDQCEGNAGFLPNEYDKAVPRRVVCTGAACPPGF